MTLGQKVKLNKDHEIFSDDFMPKGAKGKIIHIYSDSHFEVEFEDRTTLTLDKDDLDPIK